jgi:O-antigen ligase
MFHWISGVYLNSLFYNGLLNITAITIILIYFVNFTSYEQLKDGFSVSKYTIYFLLVIALIDRYSYNLDRVGDLVNPNYIAYLCVIMLFYSNIFESKILNKSFIINLIITVIVLLLTQSNGGQLALLTSLSFSIFLFRKNKSIYYAYNFALVFLVIFSISTVINYNGEISWFLEIFIKESDSSRFFIWKETFKHFLKSPIMGTPYNTFRVLWNTELLVTHNDFLRILVELGLFGLTVFVLWIFQQLRLIYRFERNLLFSLSSLLWATLIFSLSHNNINNLLFWFSIVMPSLIYKLSKTNIKS